MKENVGELKEEVMEEFFRLLRTDFTGVVKVVSGEKRLLVRFQDGCKSNMDSNQLTA